MRPRLSALLVAPLVTLGALLPGVVGAAPPPPGDAPTANDDYVATEAHRLGAFGVAVGVVAEGHVVYSGGFGIRDKYRGGRVTPQTVFRLASITKVFAGMALLRLRDEGKLTLDDAITKFLPEASHVLTPYQDALPITLRNLITHTSGLPHDVPAGGLTEGDLLQKLGWIKLEFPPGRHTSYSNLGVGLVGPIVHRASGQAFRDYVRAHILTPLGMNATVWERSDVDPHLYATGHKKDKETDKLEPEYSEWRMGAAEAFGGLYSSVDDMLRFVEFEMGAWDQGPELADVPLTRSSLRESQSVAFQGAPEPQRFGVGWVLGDDPEYGLRVWHTGATDEYSASVTLYPRQGVGVVVLSNAPYPWDTEAVAHRILKRAATLYARGQATASL